VSRSAYQDLFVKKFTNLAKKAPIMMSFIIKVQDGKEGVMISHENSGKKYFFPFNYDQQVKDFIAEIKGALKGVHYPRLIDEIYERVELTNEELAKKLESGATLDQLKKFELRKMGEKIYVIDKVLSWKDIAILVLESSTRPEDQDEIGHSFQYKFNGSLILYLKKYRSGKHPIETLSSEFFQNSILVRKLEPKDKAEEEIAESSSSSSVV
jgi:hypothetical protein